ncbi:DEAD/DEAH box helicase family protein [Enterocloster citroniae]|uniref:Helicase ATP-binding domain-containing protein n=1 Tax=[Clostridium] citroniae WAL-17108 TaxID=742733 RepID=G5HKE0_9FIRM|nr:DEAD/DEAH box helicase family protein [Enterocloster citroniae]EHE98240.1 hypothetical protein HMPREF9469_03052 [ [[Clostridium] citroniae WAL-17108]MCC3385375.1 NgoFVII family restriction endonuclease [Enterocloster citroniae]MCD8280028.1 DEAD/DEAH box helicase family protein [Enterocloster citroniae]
MGFADLSIGLRYRTEEHSFSRDFLIPVLRKSVMYKRAVGFFSSTALIELSVGLFEMARNGGKIELIASPKLSDEDIVAIQFGYKTREQAMIEALELSIRDPLDQFEEERLNLVATLIANGILELKLAFMESDTYHNMYHEKIAVFQDKDGNRISYTGSANASANSYCDNFESIYVFCDWKDATHKEFVDITENDFDRMWENVTDKIQVIPFPKVILKKLERYQKDTIDYQTDEKQFHYHKFVEDTKPFRIPQNVKLREVQKEAVSNWFNQGCRGIFSMCTGAGKSYTALACMVDLAQKLNNQLAVFIVCPQIHLVGQWEEDEINWGPPPIIAHSESKNRYWNDELIRAYKRFRNNGEPFVCITTNDTFSGRYISEIVSRLKDDQNVLLIIDEAHNFGAKRLTKCLPDNIQYRVGLSATIERHGDAKGTGILFDYFGSKCIVYDVDQAIKDGALTKYRYYPVPIYLNSEELYEYQNLTEKLKKFLVQKDGKVEISKDGELLLFKRARLLAGARNKLDLLIELLKKYQNEGHILVYCGAATTEKEETGELERQIDGVTEKIRQELHMTVHRFTAEENLRERQEIKHFFSDGLYQVVTAIKCLDEGVNIPSIRTAFIMASTRNPREFIQRRGRLLRKSPDKDYAEIYDFITLPRELSCVEHGDYEKDKTILFGEMARINEFGKLSDNPAQSDGMMNQIMQAYDVYIDIEEEMKKLEEEYSG